MHMVNSAWMFQDLPPVEIDLHGIVCPYQKSLTLWSHMCLLDVMLMSHALQGWNQFPNEWLVLTIELSSVGKAAFQVWVVWNALVENQPRVKLPTLFGCLFGGWLKTSTTYSMFYVDYAPTWDHTPSFQLFLNGFFLIYYIYSRNQHKPTNSSAHPLWPSSGGHESDAQSELTIDLAQCQGWFAPRYSNMASYQIPNPQKTW